MHTVTIEQGHRNELISASDCYADAALDGGVYELERREGGKWGAHVPGTVVCAHGTPRGQRKGDRVSVWVQFDEYQVRDGACGRGWSLR